MTIDVQGGAGGIGARLQDLRSEADLLDRLGDDVREWSGAVASTAVDEDVLAAVVLCPGEVAAVEAAVAAATLGPQGMLVVSTGFETTAVALRASASTYELVDRANERALEALGNAAGFGLGLALPGLVVGGGLLAAGGGLLLLTRPGGPQLLAALADQRERLGEIALRGLHETPWLFEGLTRMAPGLVQGGAVSISTLLAGPTGGLTLPVLLSGGMWPTGDYEDAVAGLINAGGRFGLFEDAGDVNVGKAPIPSSVTVVDGDQRVIVPYGADLHAPGSVEDIFMEQYDLYRESDPDNSGQVQIVTRHHPDGTVTHVVQIPGTEEWGAQRGDNPFDLTSNVHLMAGHDTLIEKQVIAAMKAARIEPGQPVMLTGHSQGGIIAASLASDPAFRAQYSVESVVTGARPSRGSTSRRRSPCSPSSTTRTSCPCSTAGRTRTARTS
ncbi:hypothetical protein GC089_02880 [Cellulomonas sp. JZ18]|uniref:hypothetical protein n=1 Tax=Cellulomonas sp. JZ18 TaxID=2654191 RepID=UPI0012D44ADF|nr:hypothetical protein [Cellulomonas sp. JZ18]QGQ18391.1 hypothetical protein GC089_02880 [Cellulomonas sp. JZ18]